MKGIQETRLDN